MLLPKRVKYRRVQRGRMTGKAMRGNKVNQGDYGLVALEPAWITSNQIEAARVAMTRYIKRGGKVWIKIFPDKPEWVPVRAARSTGWPSLSRAACSSSWLMSTRRPPARLCVWPATSCRFAANSSSARSLTL
jgi:hypothetical protein